MIDIEIASVEIESLVCGDDFERRLGEQHVALLAQSIREVGLIHYPVVRASDLQVIAGEDRIAAHILLSRAEVIVRMVECTDDELDAVRLAENEHRRSPQAVKELVSRIEETVVVETALDDLFEERAPGRPKTAHGIAVEKAAEVMGTTPNAVRKKLAKAKEESAPPFETWGRVPDEKIVQAAAKAHKQITEIYSKVHGAMLGITLLQKQALMRDVVANPMWEQLQTIGYELKASRPAALCAWCKGVPKVMKKCAACMGGGYISEGDVTRVPAELKEPPAVQVDEDLGI